MGFDKFLCCSGRDAELEYGESTKGILVIMQSKIKFTYALIFLMLLPAACNLGKAPPQRTTSEPDLIATFVHATLAALPGNAPEETQTPEVEATAIPIKILPNSLYFLSGQSGTTQIWRLAADGVSLEQITFEASEVSAYDISATDGSLAYVSDNRLVLLRVGSNQGEILVDGSAADRQSPDYLYQEWISNPRFSPDGRTLAFALNGIQMLNLSSGERNQVLVNQLEEIGAETVLPRELYFPESWSPNGEMLLVSIGYLEGGSLGFLDAESGELTLIAASGIVCCQSSWTPDSSSILVASPYVGLVEAGLWRYAAESGAENLLVAGSEEDGTFHLFGWPQQIYGGELFYFYSSTIGIPQGAMALFMMRSSLDGVGGQVQLRTEGFVLREALWAWDGSLAIVTETIQGAAGPLVLARTDGSPLKVLASEGSQLRWGP